jgi:hypothetical protein
LDVDNNGGTVANYTQNYLEVTVNDGLTFAGADNMIILPQSLNPRRRSRPRGL